MKSATSFFISLIAESESKIIHERAIELFAHPDTAESHLEYERRHKEIIDRFGRFPHRNEVCININDHVNVDVNMSMSRLRLYAFLFRNLI